MNEIWRDSVLLLSKYIPGEPIESVKEKYGLTKVVKMASNENPLGVSPMARLAMQEALEAANYYPEKEANSLRDKLAKKLGLEIDNMIITNGGEYALTLMGGTFVNPNDEVIYCVPSFGVYRSAAIKSQGIPVELPLTENHCFDLEAILRHITKRTKLIFICNPNNPTGTIVSSRARDEFINHVPDNVVVVFDEAYYEFIGDPEYLSGIKYLKEKKNIVVIRTFSKLYGLAGVRLGYAMADPGVIEKVFMVREAFSVNRVAVAGAIAALDDTEFIHRTLAVIASGKEYLYHEFDAIGINYIESAANFVLADVGVNVESLYEKMLMRGVIFRPIVGKLRVSVGTMEENELFIRVLKDELAELKRSGGK